MRCITRAASLTAAAVRNFSLNKVGSLLIAGHWALNRGYIGVNTSRLDSDMRGCLGLGGTYNSGDAVKRLFSPGGIQRATRYEQC
jgi:hypothetical protein